MSLARLLTCLALALAPVSGVAQAPGEVMLELDTGGHRAVIRDLSVDAAGRFVASASDDKTVRVWDLSGAAPPVVLRGYAGPGSDGVVNAVALSPDGRFAALAGYFGPELSVTEAFGDLRIFDTRTREVVRVLKGHRYVVDSLAYSPERDELAVAGQGGVVLRWKGPFGEAPEALPTLDSQASRILKVEYAAGGARLLAATTDYGLRMWDLADDAEIEPPEGEPLWDITLPGLAVSGEGARFAIGGSDGRVEIRDSLDGTVLGRLPERAFRPDALAFTGDGRLVVGCGYRCAEGQAVEIWTPGAEAPAESYAGHDGSVSAALALPNGALLTAGGRNPALHLWLPGARAASRVLEGTGGPVTAAGIAPDASWIAWGREDPCPGRAVCPESLARLTHRMEIPSGQQGFGPPKPMEVAGAARAVLSTDTLSLGFETAPGAGFDGDTMALSGPDGPVRLRRGGTDGYYHSAATIAGGEAISGGGNGQLIAYAPDGGFAGDFRGHTGEILALAASDQPARLLSASADQTMILWNLATRAEIARVFVAGDEWITWTPQGYFHSSPKGDAMVGWRVNRARDEAARYIRASELKRHLHSPEIVRRAILTGDPAQAAIDLRGTDAELGELLTRQPPAFELRLAEEIDAPEGAAILEVTGADLAELDAWGYSILVNDRRVPPLPYPDPTGQGRKLYQVPLGDGENAISVTGEDDFGYVTERSAVALSSRVAQAPERAGKLYLAVIGVADYPNLPEACNGGSCDLAYPVDDAIQMLTTLAETTGRLHTAVETLVMVSPSRLAASDRLTEALAKVAPADTVLPPEGRLVEDELSEFLQTPGPEDTTIVFVAGHGLSLDEDYYLLPEDAEQRGGEWRTRSLFDWQILQEELGYALGRRILLIDTCHAAGAFNARLEKDAADARIVVFSATAANNTAAERSDLGHGIFTYALLEGLRGKAKGGDGVRLLGLADYVYREVIRLSKSQQEPYYSLLDTTNFLLAQ